MPSLCNTWSRPYFAIRRHGHRAELGPSYERAAEVFDRRLQSIAQRHCGTPAEAITRKRDVRTALPGIVGGKRAEGQPAARARELDHQLGELDHGEFGRIADIERTGEIARRVHEQQDGRYEIADITEAAGLPPVAEDGDIDSAQRLHDESGHYPSVVGLHARAVGIEDPGHLHVQPMLP